MFLTPTLLQFLVWSMERSPTVHCLMTRDVPNMMWPLTLGHLTPLWITSTTEHQVFLLHNPDAKPKIRLVFATTFYLFNANSLKKNISMIIKISYFIILFFIICLIFAIQMKFWMILYNLFATNSGLFFQNKIYIADGQPEVFNIATGVWGTWPAPIYNMTTSQCMVQWKDSFIMFGSNKYQVCNNLSDT